MVNLKRTIASLLILSVVGTSPGYAVPDQATLSNAPFTQPLQAADERADALKAYLTYQWQAFRDSRGVNAVPDAGVFQPMVLGDKRIHLTGFELPGDRSLAAVRCEVNGHAFRALLSLADGAIVALESEEEALPLAFPDAIECSVDPAAVRRAEEIYGDIDYMAKDGVAQGDWQLLWRAFVSFMRAGFRDGRFNEVRGVERFFRRDGDVGIDRLPVRVVLDSEHAPIAVGMADALRLSHPGDAAALAVVCAALGKVSYVTRAQAGYEIAEACWRIAHSLAPDNLRYHNDWAWALNHSHRTDEAIPEIRSLIARSPDNLKFLAELAGIESVELDRRLRELEGSDIAVIQPDLYLKETASLEASVSEIIRLVTIDAARKYPRALSVAGDAYLLTARIAMFKLDYILTHDPDAAGQAGVCAKAVIDDLERSVWYHAAAVSRAGKTSEEVDHARGMFVTMASRAERLLAGWQEALDRGGVVFPRTAAQVRRTLARIDRLTRDHAFLGGGINTVIVHALSDFDTFHAVLPETFRAAALGLDESDISDPEGFAGRMAGRAYDLLVGQGIITASDPAARAALENFSFHYAALIKPDRVSMALLYVYQQVLDPDNRTPDMISEYAGCYLDETLLRGSRARLGRIARQIRLRFTEGEEERDVPVPLDRETSLIGRDVLSDAADPGNKSSLVARTRQFADSYERIALWDGEEGMNPRYIATLSAQAQALCDRADRYAEEVQRYLALPGATDRRTREATGLAVSATYRQLKRGVKELDRLFAKRYDRIRNIIMQRVVSIRADIAASRTLFGDVSIEWVDDQLALLEGYAAALAALADDASNGDYLSYESFLSLTEQADTAVELLQHVAEKLSTYNDVFDTIDRAEREAYIAEDYFGIEAGQPAAEIMQAYREELADARERIFSLAVSGADLASLGAAEREYFTGIALRTAYLARLRVTVRDVLESVGRASVYPTPEGEAETREILARLERGMKDEITGAAAYTTVSLLEEVCRLSRACPDESLMSRTMTLIDLKYKQLFIEEAAVSEARRNDFLVKTVWMNKVRPGTFTDTARHRLERSAQEHRAWIDVVSRLPVTRPGFDEALIGLREELNRSRQYYDAIMKDAYTAIRNAALAGLTETIRIGEWWLDTFILDPHNPRDRENRLECARLFAELKRLVASPSLPVARCADVRDDLRRLLGEIAAPADPIAVLSGGLSEDLTDTFVKSGYFRQEITGIPGFIRPSVANSLRNIFYPVMRDGAWVDIEVLALVLEEDTIRSAFLEKLSHYHDGVDVPASLRKKEAALKMLMDVQTERFTLPFRNGHATARLSPYHFKVLFSKTIDFYVQIAAIEKRYGNAKRPEPRSLGATDVLLWHIGYLDELFRDPQMVPEIADILRLFGDPKTVRSLHAVRIRGEEHRTDHEEVVREIYRRASMAGALGWHTENGREVFLRALGEMVTEATGETWMPQGADVPDVAGYVADDGETAPMLTVNEAGGIRVFSSYPPLKEYGALSLDTATMTFAAGVTDAGSRSVALCKALNESLRSYLGALRGPAEPAAGGVASEWEKELEAVLAAVKARAGRIGIAVVSGMPFNSLVVNDTIYLNDEFVAHLLPRTGRDEAARIIFGERIMHELGHVADMPLLRRIDGVFNRRVEAETRQAIRDTIFYARIFGRDSARAEAVDRFVHEIPKGASEKFSRVFKSEYLYRSIGEWARLYRSGDRQLMEERVRTFVIDVVKRLSISNPSLFPFPAFDDTEGAGAEKPARTLAADALLAIEAARELASLESGLIDGREARAPSFFEKKRVIAVSEALVPACQRRLIGTINKLSRQAVDGGRTKELIRICSFGEIDALKADASTDVVVIMEAGELAAYTGTAPRLAFSRREDSPVLLNGIIASGRALLYGDMARLCRILSVLSGDPHLALPDAEALERLLKDDKDAFAKRVLIRLPAMVRFDTESIAAVNRVVMEVMQYV